jgi:GH15 family glucan-1,4-alpha-glucosidase
MSDPRLLDRPRLLRLARRSVAIIRENQDASGAYLASPNFPVYRYSWLRDGSFIADAMSRTGDAASAELFFGWCARVIEARRARIESLAERGRAGDPIDTEEFLPTRYTVAGHELREGWTDFQLDGYGTWLWALEGHRRRHNRSIEPYLSGAALSARYVAAFWGRASYDWWEEHPDHRHTSTLASLWGGLRAAASWEGLGSELRDLCDATAGRIRDEVLRDARRLGYLPKWIGGDAVDASLIAAATPFELIEPDDPLMAATLEAIERELVTEGGVHRYAQDTYYGGGEWLLLAGLLGWHYAAAHRVDDAWAELVWIAEHAQVGDELPEQVPDHLIAPDRFAEWRDRWGPIATPLLWSHAMFLTLALVLGAVTPDQLVEEADGEGAAPPPPIA